MDKYIESVVTRPTRESGNSCWGAAAKKSGVGAAVPTRNRRFVNTLPLLADHARLTQNTQNTRNTRNTCSAASPQVAEGSARTNLLGRIFVFAGIATLALLAACSHIEPRASIVEPTSARPTQIAIIPPTDGAIFQQAGHRPLFEDPRARLRGDIITIAINEKNSASRKSSSTTSKTNDIKAGIPTLGGLATSVLRNADVSANTANTYAGKGDTSNDNAFTGTITVTVVNVLPNGNLVVTGEKQIGINHNLEFVRFSGVINPVTLQAGNMVESTKVADARLEYTGKGYIDEAQRMGWLSRFFLNFSPL